jgi:small subunit ribosomal protein S5
MTKTKTIPHLSQASYGAAKVVLRPAAPGSGVIAGGAGRAVLELAGIKNILAKQLGSKNKINNARATLLALQQLEFITTSAKLRGVSLERLTGRHLNINNDSVNKTDNLKANKQKSTTSKNERVKKQED